LQSLHVEKAFDNGLEIKMDRLKILSIGAGAIGTYIGGSLELQGHHVVFLERPEIADEIRTRGLMLRLGEKKHKIQKPKVICSLDEVAIDQKFHVAIFALKSYDTQNFIQSIVPSKDLLPPILCFSNGVENEPALSNAFGDDKVIAGTITSAIGRHVAGDITLEKLRGVGVAGGHILSKPIVKALDEAGLNAQFFTSALAMKWSKMLTNLLVNASSAILNMSPVHILSNPGLYHLEITQLREALHVMRTQGIQVVDLPGTPVRLLAFAIGKLPERISRPLLKNAIGSGRGAKMPSFHIDLHSGRNKSEVDYLNGAVVRAGKKYNIPTPANMLLNQTLLALTRGDIKLDTYQERPDILLSEFSAVTRKN
jgi:2-dehydropantoate 2-reductase